MYIQYIQGLCQSVARYSRLCPISGSLRYNGSLDTWMVVCLVAAKFMNLICSVTGMTSFKAGWASVEAIKKMPLPGIESDWLLSRGGWSPNWVHSARRPLLAYCTCPRWLWGWRIWSKEDCRGNRSTRRKPAPAPICPPQIPLAQNRARTRTDAVGSQWLTAWAMARPFPSC
jgi:hypothetical protein